MGQQRFGQKASWTRGGNLLSHERGSELLEFGIVGLLFFSLVFGIMEFGRAVWIYDTVAHAARVGARYAIVRGAESGRAAAAGDVETYVRSRATGMTAVTVATTCWPAKNLLQKTMRRRRGTSRRSR